MRRKYTAKPSKIPSENTPKRAVRPRSVLLLLGTYSPAAHRGIARFAAEKGWHLQADMARIPRVPYGWQGDGIIAGLGEWDEPVKFLRIPTIMRIPTVDIHQIRPEIPLPRVSGDHREVGRQAADHLVACGWRGFAWFSRVNHPVARLRLTGFAERLRVLGMTAPLILAPEISEAGSPIAWQAVRSAVIRDLRTASVPLGLLAYNDFDAALVQDACQVVGLRVPEDVGLVGVDNNELVVNSLPVPLSSVRLDLETIGYVGAALLERLMNGEAPDNAIRLIPPRGVEARASTDTTPSRHPVVRQALAYIRRHFPEKITVSRVAAECGVSRRTLEVTFQKDLQRSVHSYLVQLRLREAGKRLVAGKDSIESIAKACGFAHGPHLHVGFKRAYGISPRAWQLAHPAKEGIGAGHAVRALR